MDIESPDENEEDNLIILNEVESNSDFEEEPKKPLNNKSGTRLHTIESKLKIIKYAKEHSRKEACNKFSIPNSTLSDWFKNEVKFKSLPAEKLKKTNLHKGGSLLYPDIEIQLINFIEFNRKMFNPITTWSILLKLLELKPERKSKSIKANQQFIYRFMIRNNYSFRTHTHIGQSLAKNCFTLVSIFLNNVTG